MIALGDIRLIGYGKRLRKNDMLCKLMHDPDILTRIKFNELSYTVNNKQVLKNIKIKRIFPEVLYFSLGSKTRKLQNIFSAQVSCLARF